MDIIHIVIDIDNTILDGTTTHLKYCNLVSGKNIKKEEVTQFYIYHYYDWTLDDFERVYEQYGIKMHEESLPFPYAIEYINELYKEHMITFMTARPEQYRDVTEKWLQNYNVSYHQLIMTDEKLNKFKSINGDILIDDSPHYAKQFQEQKLPMILVHYPYNNNKYDSNIYRCMDWHEIYKTIKDFKK